MRIFSLNRFSYTLTANVSNKIQIDSLLFCLHHIITQCVSNYSSYVLCKLLSYKIHQLISLTNLSCTSKLYNTAHRLQNNILIFDSYHVISQDAVWHSFMIMQLMTGSDWAFFSVWFKWHLQPFQIVWSKYNFISVVWN